jgi:predicted lipid-binding transport protein (Tim44 family)
MPLSLTISASAPIGVSYYFDTVGIYNGAFFVVAALTTVAAFIIMLSRKPQKPRARPAADTQAPAPATGLPPSGRPAEGRRQPDGRVAVGARVAAGARDDGASSDSGDGSTAAAGGPHVAAPTAPRRRRRDYMHGPR